MATLATLRARAQSEADFINSDFVTSTPAATAEWTRYINAGYAELYGLVLQAYGNDYYTQTPFAGYTFTTDGINQNFALPADFFKLLGCDVLFGAANQWVQLHPFTFQDRNRFSGTNQSIPAAGQTVRLLYIPKLVPLAADADTTIDLQNDWEQYIVTFAAMKALAKEESDVTVKMAELQGLRARIAAEAENRDAGNPMRMVDSRGKGSPTMAYRLNGSYVWLIGQRVDAWPGGSWGYSNYGDAWW